VEFVCGETTPLERARIINGFKAQEFRILVNPNLLTTGFDAPHVDAVCLLRATLSPGLFYQMVGRSFRPHHGKRDALILDFGSNIVRHGTVDNIQVKAKNAEGGGEAPAKECPECHLVSPAGTRICLDCGYEWPVDPEPKHDATASEESPVALAKSPPVDTWVDVRDVWYAVHKKKGAKEGAPRTLRVDYEISLTTRFSEWICLEHDGFVRGKACAWWTSRAVDRGLSVPGNVDDAVAIANAGGLAFPRRILVREEEGERFPRIIEAELEWPERGAEEEETAPVTIGHDMNDIPF
jgi:DNA repair protein RadD